MATFLRFVAGIVLYFAAADLLINFLEIPEGSNTWLFMNIFSGCIGIVAAFFVSPTVACFIGLYQLYEIGSTIWNEKGFWKILFMCVDPLIQLMICGFLLNNFKDYADSDTQD